MDAALKVAYGRPVPWVAETMRRNVIDRVESLAGLGVVEVDIDVNDTSFPGQEQRRQHDQGR